MFNIALWSKVDEKKCSEEVFSRLWFANRQRSLDCQVASKNMAFCGIVHLTSGRSLSFLLLCSNYNQFTFQWVKLWNCKWPRSSEPWQWLRRKPRSRKSKKQYGGSPHTWAAARNWEDFLAVSKQSSIHQKVVGTFSLQLSISFQVQVQIENELGKLLF